MKAKNPDVAATTPPDTLMTANDASIFERCHAFFGPDSLYAEIKGANLYPYFRAIERNDGTRAFIQGKEVIMAGSNNYLGLTSDERVKKAAIEAIREYGTGCTGSRFLNGTLDLHILLEERLARFMNKEACVLFSTGYMTNLGVIQALTTKGDFIFSDKDNHACIVAGTQVTRAETIRFKHNDIAHLRRLLEKNAAEYPSAGRMIVTDGVFSMSGVIAHIPELVSLAKEFNAGLYVDDAHAVGVVGPGGQGSAAYHGMLDEVDLITGTFSKSFSSLGGFCVGSKDVIEYVRHHASAHIFSASMPPANVATVLKCMDILEDEPWRLERLWEISDYMRSGFSDAGFNVLHSQSPIIPVVVGDLTTCFKFWTDLLDEGVFVNAVVPPAVPRGQSLMRTSYMATHTDDDLDYILGAFKRVGLKHGVIGTNGQ